MLFDFRPWPPARDLLGPTRIQLTTDGGCVLVKEQEPAQLAYPIPQNFAMLREAKDLRMGRLRESKACQGTLSLRPKNRRATERLTAQTSFSEGRLTA